MNHRYIMNDILTYFVCASCICPWLVCLSSKRIFYNTQNVFQSVKSGSVEVWQRWMTCQSQEVRSVHLQTLYVMSLFKGLQTFWRHWRIRMITTLEIFQMSGEDSDSLAKDSVSHAVPQHIAESRCVLLSGISVQWERPLSYITC